MCFRVKTACQAENWNSPGAGDKTECSGCVVLVCGSGCGSGLGFLYRVEQKG